MSNPKIILVIPHHLPTLEFLNEWKKEILQNDVHVIIVEDKPTQETLLQDWQDGSNTSVYTHEDIDDELGENSWIIPRGTSAIRSFGLYKAWQEKPDMIVTLDNDCFPDLGSNYFQEHWGALETPGTLDWVRSTSQKFMNKESRGFPYLVRDTSKTYINHGLWSNIPDLDAASMLLYPKFRTPIAMETQVIPRWNFYPQCSMNLAFRPEVTPLLYHGLFGKKYGFDQFDDIWAGVFSKKVADHLGWAVRSGSPSVEHRKQSNALTNFEKQAGGMKMNEELWQKVRDIRLTKTDPVFCYAEMLDQLEMEGKYWEKVKKATKIWLNLFK